MTAGYMILETNNRIIGAVKRAAGLQAEDTREELTKRFPGRRVLSPLEPHIGGPLQVVTVYMSRTRDGKARFSSIEQWGLV